MIEPTIVSLGYKYSKENQQQLPCERTLRGFFGGCWGWGIESEISNYGSVQNEIYTVLSGNVLSRNETATESNCLAQKPL